MERKTESLILDFMHALNLKICSIRLVVMPEDEVIFLEVNEQRNFLFLEESCPGLNICTSVCDFSLPQQVFNQQNGLPTMRIFGPRNLPNVKRRGINMMATLRIEWFMLFPKLTKLFRCCAAIAALLCTSAQAIDAPCLPQTKLDVGLLTSRLIIVGETHGTKQIPEFVGSLACSLANANRPLLVGLEMSIDEQKPILEYIESAGTAEDKSRLTAGKFWHPYMFDGRSGEAMVKLIDDIRILHLAKKDVLLFAMDISDSEELLQLSKDEPYWVGHRDALMALNIEIRLRQYPNHTALILVGNYHSEKNIGTPENKDLHPMAEILSHNFKIQNIDFSTTGGDAWACDGASAETAVCGPHSRKARARFSGSMYDFVVPLGKISASPPAVNSAN
ncbi:hypothetical protein [Undibacterium sp.]|uniref:hypothetical protein n=1 Tax=Undibacterium sp. TaxID=1914977 RepID=UPI00374CC768